MQITNYSGTGYRPDIDGLRGLAVLSVMVYHAGFGLRGGFVGVDVFFVISGYLITHIIAQDLVTGRFSLRHFWERRLRRILPAVLVMMTIVLGAGYYLLLPIDYSELAQATLAQLICGGNVFYWLQTGYFAAPADVKPLLHVWSLAVEEQFYLLFPVVMQLLFCRARRYAIPLLAILAACSFIACAWMTPRYPNAAFYLLPTRAWELLVGSLVALTPPSPTRLWLHRSVPQLLGLAGIAGLACSAVLFKADSSFPGVKAAIPVCSTALLIHLHRSYDTWPRRILSHRWLVAIGLISYSLYLWHWPLMAMTRYLTAPTPTIVMAIPFVVSFPIAFASWKFVEQPVRRRIKWTGRGLYGRAAAAAMVPCFVSLCVWSGQGWPSRLARAMPVPELPQTLADRFFTSEVDFTLDELPHLGTPDLEPSFLLWGDSHAQALAPLIDEVAREMGLAGRMVARGGTPTLINTWRVDSTAQQKEDVMRWNENVLNEINSRPWRAILVVVAWQNYTGDAGLVDAEGQASALQVLERQLAKTTSLIQVDSPVFWIRPPPRQTSDVAAALRKQTLHTWMAEPSQGLDRQQFEAQTSGLTHIFKELQNAQHTWVDPSYWFFDTEGQPRLFNGPDLCYVDDNHVSRAGARLYYGQAITQILQTLASRQTIEIK